MYGGSGGNPTSAGGCANPRHPGRDTRRVGHRPGRPPSRSSGLRHGRGPRLEFLRGLAQRLPTTRRARSSRRRISALPPVERRTGIRAGSTLVSLTTTRSPASSRSGRSQTCRCSTWSPRSTRRRAASRGSIGDCAIRSAGRGRSRCQRASRGDRSQCRGYGKTGRPSVSGYRIRPEPAAPGST